MSSIIWPVFVLIFFASAGVAAVGLARLYDGRHEYEPGLAFSAAPRAAAVGDGTGERGQQTQARPDPPR